MISRNTKQLYVANRNAGTISTQFAEPAFGVSVTELEEDLRASGFTEGIDPGYLAAAMVGTAFEVGVAMISPARPDVEGATGFVTELFLGGIERLRAGSVKI